MSNLIILYSGGADSRLMLEFAKAGGYEPYCVLVDYGQTHVEELNVAMQQLSALQIPYKYVDIKTLNPPSGLTTGEENTTGEVHEMHVPGRNTILLSIAFSIAETEGIDKIWFGADWSDRLNLFPDCYQEYVVAINDLFKVAGPKPIDVEAPLLGMSKELILSILNFAYGVTEKDLYSGYGNLENVPREEDTVS
jgi:7-cyano-7-deazaguanine synthase